MSIAERYARAEALLPWNALRHIYGWRVHPQWLAPGDDRFWYRVRTRRGHEFILVDPAARQRRPAFDHARLAAALAQALGRPVEPYALPFAAIELDPDRNAMSFGLDGAQWRLDLASYALVRAEPPPAGELLSPDGRWAAYVDGYNLWVRDTISGERVQLTADGERHYAYASEPAGSHVGVSEELAGVRRPPSASWSPDSRRIFTLRLDERRVPEMHLLQHVPPQGFRPLLHSYRLALAEDAERPLQQYLVVDVAARAITPIRHAPFDHTMDSLFFWGLLGLKTPRWWSPDSRHIYLHRWSDGERSLELIEADAATGAARTVVAEHDSIPVRLNLFPFDNPNYRVLSASGELIWFARRRGWGHLELRDLASGALKAPITAGPWAVRDILHVDEAGRRVYFTAGGLSPRDPYERRLCRVSLDGGDPELLSPEEGEHLLSAAPSGAWFVDSYGSIDRPLRTVLRDADGAIVLELEQGDADDLVAAGYRYPEPFSARGRDGATEIYGAMFFPSDFDPARRYPLIDAIYGGPQLTIVPKAFPHGTGSPHEAAMPVLLDDLWEPQSLAELGFIVVAMDGMGTPYRDQAFHAVAWSDAANGGGLADHVAVIRALAAERPYIDLERVGIYGHSAGGDNSLRAMLAFPDFFKVCVSSAGAHEMRGYSASLIEGWAGADYGAHVNAARADRLAGRLLLVTGDMDENCHPLHTMRVVDALIKANKDFDMLVLPNRNHGFTSDPYFIRRRWDYFVRHLLGADPPAGYAVQPGLLEEVL